MSPGPELAADAAAPIARRFRATSAARLQRLEWCARRAVGTTVSGEYRSAFRGRGMEFDQVLRYQWGDDPRDIDWNVTARLGEPYRKKFVEERDLAVVLLFEDSPALQFGSTARSRRETLLETAALLMLIGALNRDRVGVLYCAPGRSWFQRPRSGQRGVLRLASRLLAEPAPPLDGPPHCLPPWTFLRRCAPRGSVLVWAGPFVPTDAPPALPALRARYQLVGLRADDPWDVALPPSLRVAAYDPLAGRLTTLDSASAAERAAHARWRVRREAWYAELFPEVDDRMPVGNGDDPLATLIAWFHRHRRRGSRARTARA